MLNKNVPTLFSPLLSSRYPHTLPQIFSHTHILSCLEVDADTLRIFQAILAIRNMCLRNATTQSLHFICTHLLLLLPLFILAPFPHPHAMASSRPESSLCKPQSTSAP